MQYRKEEIYAQQLVLAFLGFYQGRLDGIWSDKTIAAQKAFECDDSFMPAVPTFGLPFRVNCRLPKGMVWDRGLVTHVKLTPEKAQEIIKARTFVEKPAVPVIEAKPQETPAVETASVSTEEKSEVAAEEKPNVQAVQRNQQQGQQRNPQQQQQRPQGNR